MNFQSRDSHSSLLFKSNHVLRFEDKILVENILFINKSFDKYFFLQSLKVGSPSARSDVHNYQTVSSTAEKIFKPSYRTDSRGKNSIIV